MFGRYVNLFTFLSFLFAFSISTTSSYAESKIKDEFLKQKVTQGHDFTKIPEKAKYKPGFLLVRFAPKADKTQLSKIEKKQILNSLGGATIKLNLKMETSLFLVELPPGQSVEYALKLYNARDDILYAEPDYEITIFSTFPNDTYFNSLWGMHNTGQSGGTPDADIDAPEAWDIRTDANDIIVAVIDTGVDYNHFDLAENIWINTDEEPNDANNDGRPGISGFDDDVDNLIDEDSNGREPGDPNWTNDLFEDDDENGYVDDFHGYDFCTYEGKERDSDPDDDHGHGTHVSGTIGAIGNNEEGVIGVCWNVKIMALKFLDYNGYGSASDAIACIKYAIENGAKVLNNSWGGSYYSQSLKDAIEDAQDAGVLFVAAAGNSGFNTDIYHNYPSGYDLDNVISVMATDHNDTRSIWSPWNSSNYGAISVDLSAPGSDILSCLPDNNYYYAGGTSMAAPHVAGACALLWAQHPDWNHHMVKATILNSVDNLSSLNGLCVSGGRLNLHNALLSKPPFL